MMNNSTYYGIVIFLAAVSILLSPLFLVSRSYRKKLTLAKRYSWVQWVFIIVGYLIVALVIWLCVLK